MKAPLFTFLPLLLALWTGAVAVAGPPVESYGARAGLLLAQGYSLDEAVSGVRRRHQGKVLSAETVRENGRPVHRIRVIEDGRVRGLRYDGNTGEPLPNRRSQQAPQRYPAPRPRR